MAEEGSAFRSLGGAAGVWQRSLLIALTAIGALYLLDLHLLLGLVLLREQYLALILALTLGAAFLSIPTKRSSDGAPWYDWLLSFLGLIVGFYLLLFYPDLIYTLGELRFERMLLGVIALLLVTEATRRLMGWLMVALIGLLLLYARYADLVPGLLRSKGISWERLFTSLYISNDALLGTPLNVVGTVVVAFILFGRALYVVRGDRFLTDLSLMAMGRYRGGPAKVAIVSSSLFGTVSGSAVANVVVDGAITIPMMKRGGYPPHMAAAIEAVASNGGQIMPPVMGAAAFVMAEFLSIPYGEVALAAIVPACLYYLALFTQVDLEAAKLGLSGFPSHELPKLRSVMRLGWVFLLPLALLIYTLMIASWNAGKAGMAAVIATLVVGVMRRETRPSLREILASIQETGQILVNILVVAALSGLIIGAMQISGLTFRFSMLLMAVSGQNVLLLLSLTAIVCILLGLSLPTTAVYITLAVLVGPALTQMGIPPLAAHLFLFYFGMLSLITPPDCLATYTAAAIAQADMWKAGWTGMRLGIAAYVVPFIFAFQPGLLLKGTAGEIAVSVITASVGVIILSVGCAGYLFRPVNWGKRCLLWLAGLALMLPAQGLAWLMVNALGLAISVAVFLWEWRLSRRAFAPAKIPPVVSQTGS
jgi:TRAP transporter 4TM/12TM fusion protein